MPLHLLSVDLPFSSLFPWEFLVYARWKKESSDDKELLGNLELFKTKQNKKAEREGERERIYDHNGIKEEMHLGQVILYEHI